jgi:SAM-dependent methyltransferase
MQNYFSISEAKTLLNGDIFIRGWVYPDNLADSIVAVDESGNEIAFGTLNLPRQDVELRFKTTCSPGWSICISFDADHMRFFSKVKIIFKKKGETLHVADCKIDNDERKLIGDHIDFLTKNNNIVQHPSTLNLDSILTDLNKTGFLDVREIDFSGFDSWLEKINYHNNYPAYVSEFGSSLIKKAAQHFLSLALLDIHSEGVLIDIASSNSCFFDIINRTHQLTHVFRQDLNYDDGVNGDKIGCDAANIPVSSNSINYLTLHCSWEHFENNSDTNFIKEASRILVPGGKLCIIPLYLHSVFTIFTSPQTWLSKYKNAKYLPHFDSRAEICFKEDYRQRQFKFFDVKTLYNDILSVYRDAFSFQVVYFSNAIRRDGFPTFALLGTKNVHAYEVSSA